MDDAARQDGQDPAAPPVIAGTITPAASASAPAAPAAPTTDASAEAPLRRRLGRGLNALLGAAAQADLKAATAEGGHKEADLRNVPLDLIDRNPYQPRTEFKQDAINDLAESIKLHGVLQPLLVRVNGPRFQLIAGERRMLASKQAGLTEVPCRVMDLVDQEVSEAALEENLKREDLGPLEKAQAFQDYLDKFATSIEEVGRKFSMSRSAVSNLLRLLELPEAVKKALRSEKLTYGHARALLPLSEEQQVAVCKRIIQEQLSVRKAEEAVKEVLGRDPNVLPMTEQPAEAAAKPAVSNHILSVQQQLRDALGLQAEIRLKGTSQEAGKVLIPFENNDEFERIVRLLRKAA